MTIEASVYIDYCDAISERERVMGNGYSNPISEVDGFISTVEKAIHTTERALERLDSMSDTEERQEDSEEYKRMITEMKGWLLWADRLKDDINDRANEGKKSSNA
ncbi:hypothetical protein SAMD00023353_4000770 [Rosellinia necatrix]|uniref:Uncharacterized protein n=1 Tax=Rosellinia necatrix TaxID=77044 RepID=A0A1W2TM81_ROSNE|nr:hypothetical protein SAMD00023353_4000770 [Rosellinia necatrix]